MFTNDSRFALVPASVKTAITNALQANEETFVLHLHKLIAEAAGLDISLQIDHINGDKLDNRISNLRVATNAQNACNRPKQANNTSGFKGVTFDKSRQKWKAQITSGNVFVQKRFNTKEEAIDFYNEKAKEYHKEYAPAELPRTKVYRDLV